MPTPPDAPYKLKQRKLSNEELAVGAAASAKIGGCTCNPEITVRDMGDNVFVADVAHDSWCPHPSPRDAS